LTKDAILAYRRLALIDFIEETVVFHTQEEVTAGEKLGLAQNGS
jgi:hypothetical protein